MRDIANKLRLRRLGKCPTSPSSQKNPDSLTNYITVYFDIAYFLCFCPFRFVSDENGWFHLKTALPQKILCALLNFLSILSWILDDFRKNITLLSDNRNPLIYFSFIRDMLSFTFQMISLKTYWFRQVDFLGIVNYINSEHKGTAKKIQGKTFSRIICFIFAIMALYQITWGRILAPSSTWNETLWNRKLISEARYMFFITSREIQTAPNDWTALDSFLVVIVALSLIARVILGFFLDLGVLFAVLTAWTPTYVFAQSLEMDNNLKKHHWALRSETEIPSIPLDNNKAKTSLGESNWEEIYQTYHYIRELCHLINSTFGTMMTLYLADSILYHSLGMDTVLVTPDIAQKIRLMFFICASMCTFILSADTHRQLDALKMWLGKDENRQNIPTDQLNFVMSELQFNMVGIRGSNIFTITYSLLWNVLTTVVTYFIICLQTRQQQQLYRQTSLNLLLKNHTEL